MPRLPGWSPESTRSFGSDLAPNRALNTGAPLIELRHVTVVRDLDRSSARPALDDVTLAIDAGEHVCILGPNGCGKSTLIKTITRE